MCIPYAHVVIFDSHHASRGKFRTMHRCAVEDCSAFWRERRLNAAAADQVISSLVCAGHRYGRMQLELHDL
eukprot:1039387-Pleurochrysis_carterae.AAC.3